MNDRQRSGVLVLSILLVAAGGFSALSAANGGLGSVDGSSDAEASDCEGFPAPIELSTAGLTLSIGPPEDLDGDGLCEDLNGDGESTLLDALLHAVVVTAIDAGELDPTAEQVATLDVDRDGEAEYDDAFALAWNILATDDDGGGLAVATWVETIRATIQGIDPEEPTDITDIPAETTANTGYEEVDLAGYIVAFGDGQDTIDSESYAAS